MRKKYLKKKQQKQYRKKKKMTMYKTPYQRTHKFKFTCSPQAYLIAGGTAGVNGSYTPSTGFLVGPSSSATDNLYFAFAFQFADIPNASSLGSLFDAYRIDNVKITFTPAQNVSSGTSLGTPANLIPPLMATVIDYDDINLGSTITEFEQYETYKQAIAMKPHSRYLVPKASMYGFKNSGTAIGYVQKAKQWCDMATQDILHYGVHGIVFTNTTAANNWKSAWYVRVTYNISCQQVR